MAIGRPSDYTPELADRICNEIAVGRSLNRICREHDDIPSQQTVYTWLRSHESFLEKYRRAREDQQEARADEIIEISDDVAGSTDAAVVNAARLRVDTRKWLMAKLLPKKYGDKVEVNATLTLAAFVDQVERIVNPVIEHEADDSSANTQGIERLSSPDDDPTHTSAHPKA